MEISSPHGLIIFPWPDINNGGHTLGGLAPSKVEAGGGVGGDIRGQCVEDRGCQGQRPGGTRCQGERGAEEGPEVVL